MVENQTPPEVAPSEKPMSTTPSPAPNTETIPSNQPLEPLDEHGEHEDTVPFKYLHL